MASEYQGNDSDPVEIEQYTEIFLLKEIRLTLKEIHSEVEVISRIMFIAGITAVILLLGYIIGSVLSWIF